MSAAPSRPHPRPVALATAVAGLGVPDPGTADLTGATLDSRLVQPGDLYVALPGARAHGAAYASGAVSAGAAAVLTDPAGAAQLDVDVPVVVVDDPRRAMAEVAATVYGRPAERLAMFGVTGTNGKTTTALLLEYALRALGHRTGTIGTIGFRLDGQALDVARTTVTTPESPELQALLAIMAERGADWVAMEVSSHAMALHRADAIDFDVAGFTNLGRDHLDFHGTMDAYFDAKASLFTADHTRAAVVNADDPWGVRLLERVRAAGDVDIRTFGWESAADYRVREVASVADGRPEVTLATPSGDVTFVLGLPGDHNVRNAATALAMVDLAGLDLHAAARGLDEAQVPGRMQRVFLDATPTGQRAPEVYVDFAHTPDAVTAAVASFAPRRADGHRLVVVLGCGGDRDRTKRVPMGRAAVTGTDLAVITDDNPRSEEPAAIRAEVLDGAREARGVVVDGGDRRAAIRLALREAGPDGIVLVLGKGHEQGQDIRGVVTPFDDATVVAQQWAALRSNTPRPGREEDSWNR
ncbi:UDP-N-acetylmuramoyl-L-alanyl-D-glutamate--2,6-diaminopimelate ligase [Mariniluteicoccus endophyticus]